MSMVTKVRAFHAWDDVRLFLALSRASTVGEAARSLGIDPSTASRRLAALEEALSTKLFTRARDGIRPTEAAEELFEVAEEIERGVARFTRAADRLEREVSGTVRMTCPPDVAEVIVAPIVADLLRTHPSLRLSLNAGEPLLDLTRREADLALRIVRPTRGDLVLAKVGTAKWVLVASRALADAVGPVEDWAEVPYVGWDERSTAATRWFEERSGLDPVLRSDSLLTRVALARAGAGAVLLPWITARFHGLVPVELAPGLEASLGPWPTDDLFLVTHQALRDVPRVRAVWDALVERLRALQAEAA